MARTTKGLLKEILSGDLETIYINITKKAAEWALGGFLEEANKLLTNLWQFIPYMERRGDYEGFQVFWTVANKRPPTIPFPERDITAIEAENMDNLFSSFSPSYLKELANIPIGDLHGHELFMKAIAAAWSKSEETEVFLDAIERSIEEGGSERYTYHATTCGAFLAARYKHNKKAEQFIRLWGQKYIAHPDYFIIPFLMRNRALAGYLLKGLLAETFKLTKEICEAETRSITEALSERMLHGKTLVYKDLSWQQLISTISSLVIEQKTLRFKPDIEAKIWLGSIPATGEEIEQTEKRLGIIFPNDYKNFLLTSNGFHCFSNTGVTLVPVNKVDLLKNAMEDLVDIWPWDEDEDKTKFANSILISEPNEEQQLLLIPLENNEWECWFFAAWLGEQAVYQGFRYYIEEELQKLEDDSIIQDDFSTK